MQDRYLLWLLLQQASMENLCKEMVIPVPLALIIKWKDKKVASLQGLQQSFALFPVGDGVTQRTTHTVKN